MTSPIVARSLTYSLLSIPSSSITPPSSLFRKIPECKHLIEAGKKRGLMIMAVVPKPNDGTKGLVEFYPTAEALLEVGMDQVYEPPHGSKFDVVECAVSFLVFNGGGRCMLYYSNISHLILTNCHHTHTHVWVTLYRPT